MIIKFKDKYPSLHENSFVAENSSVIGSVTLREDASIWFNAVVRADGNSIHIGKGSNIQDNSTVHINEEGSQVHIGENVTVGHGCILHGCKLNSNCLIGMGSIILDGAEIGEWTIIGAGSLVPGNKKIPSGVLCMGSPAKVIRELSEDEKQDIVKAAKHYASLSKEYK